MIDLARSEERRLAWLRRTLRRGHEPKRQGGRSPGEAVPRKFEVQAMHVPMLAAAVGTGVRAPDADGGMHRGAIIDVGRRDGKVSLSVAADSEEICLEWRRDLMTWVNSGRFSGRIGPPGGGSSSRE